MILSLDVAFRNIGWAIISDIGNIIEVGVIHTEKAAKKSKVKKSDENVQNISYIIEELDSILNKHQITKIIGELPHGGSQNARASNQMGMATALIVTYTLTKNIPSIWCSPNDVKKAVCGKLNAEKDEIMTAITNAFPDYTFPKAKNKFEHIADAIGAFLATKNKIVDK